MIIAFDLGGTRLKSAAVSSSGEVHRLRVDDTGGHFDQARTKIAEIGREIISDGDFSGVGLCVPGLVKDNVVVSLPGKLEGVEGFDLEAFLSSEFELPSVVTNDAIAYGAGEATFGAGAGHDLVVVVTIGTGVGVTATNKGIPVTDGVFGGGILGGHIPISEATSGPTDSNGRPDTIEASCAAHRIVERANAAGGSYERVEDVYEAHESGEAPAQQGIWAYRQDLTRALVALAHAHGPEAIILGGGPLAPGNPLLEGLEDQVNERLFGSYRTAVKPAALGDAAALCGLARIHQGSSGP